MSVFRDLLMLNLKPSYTEVNYLQGTSYNLGSNYIDTGYIPNSDTKIEIKYEFTSDVSHNYDRLMGSEVFWCFTLSGSNLYCSIDGTNTNWQGNVSTNNQHILVIDNSSITIDNVLRKTITPVQISTNRSLWLFGMNHPSTDRDSTGRIYYCKIWENDNLVRDIIPILDANNTPCMYDKITNTIYYNQGSGSFTWG